MPEFEANFDIQPVQIEANFDVQNKPIEAIFELNAIMSDKFFVFEQGVASEVWEVNHKLNKFPSVTVVDTAENIVDGSVEYIDYDNVIIRFNGAFKGKAYFN